MSIDPPRAAGSIPPRRGAKARLWTALCWMPAVALCLVHGWGIWLGMGGSRGLTNGWPLARHDHPTYLHSALVTRDFLRLSGTTAGYDPSFMSGYAKSVIFPASSTLPELVIALFGGSDPILAYKVYVLISAALLPWLVGAAGFCWRMGPRAGGLGVAFFLVYLWSDFPINYAEFGMLPYLLAIPLGLLVVAAITLYLDRGGFGWWLIAAIGSTGVVLVHLTSAMVVAPAAVLAYLAALGRARWGGKNFRLGRHVGLWIIPVVVLVLNAFWWWPGPWLASTKGPSDFAFVHPEPVWERIAKITWGEPHVELTLCLFGILGLVPLARRDPVTAAGLGGLMAAGFAWGYLSGAVRVLDFLQPGRHTYAFFTVASLTSGLGLSALGSWVGRRNRVLGAIVVVGALVGGLWRVVPELRGSLHARLERGEPFLSSRPPPRLHWVIERVGRFVKPGERLLYEEGGFGLSGIPDPFGGGRYSGLLPHFTGVEVLGGPYLHASLTTNFTQFGEGRLFGAARWNRDHFLSYARLYRPAAIVCWSPWARAFCRSNRELIEVLDDDGVVLIGRVVGFGGATIRGEAKVEAEPGRLRISGIVPDVDGMAVLRYHFAPFLRSRPPARLVPVKLGGDPVPFIGVGPSTEALVVELDVLP